MKKEKQIEVMADDIWYATDALKIGETEDVAKSLYAKGYRKSEDVAREIFEEIDRMIYKVLNDRHYIMGDMCYEVEELKKKYTESEEGQWLILK